MVIYHSTTPNSKEYSVVDEPIDDLEEPTIAGPEPNTARDFVEDALPGPETAPRH